MDADRRTGRGAGAPAGSRQRLVLPLVAEHEVEVAERERGQRLLGLGLDQLAAQPRRLALQRSIAGIASLIATDWKRRDPRRGR